MNAQLFCITHRLITIGKTLVEEVGAVWKCPRIFHAQIGLNLYYAQSRPVLPQQF